MTKNIDYSLRNEVVKKLKQDPLAHYIIGGIKHIKNGL